MPFDPDRLLAALPRTEIGLMPPGSASPGRPRSLVVATTYNGFTPQERSRTDHLAKWLTKAGRMPAHGVCDICRKPASERHAESYYDLSTWVDICNGCHRSLHGRFRTPAAWRRRLDAHGLAADHWTRLVSREPFDLASLLRERGAVEPKYQSFIETHRQ